MGAVAVVAAGRGGSLGPAYDDRADVRLPADRPVTGDDLRALRFNTALRGYRASEVDALIDRLAAQLDDAMATTAGREAKSAAGPRGLGPRCMVVRAGAGLLSRSLAPLRARAAHGCVAGGLRSRGLRRQAGGGRGAHHRPHRTRADHRGLAARPADVAHEGGHSWPRCTATSPVRRGSSTTCATAGRSGGRHLGDPAVQPRRGRPAHPPERPRRRPEPQLPAPLEAPGRRHQLRSAAGLGAGDQGGDGLPAADPAATTSSASTSRCTASAAPAARARRSCGACTAGCACR